MRRYRIDIGEPIRLGDLDFADDISPLKTFRLRLQTFINSFKDTAEQFGLKINTNKTKAWVPVDLRPGTSISNKSRYLGSTVENTGSNA